MDLKNAVAVCLISLFSATLVVLIARTLDSQAASRLSLQLASIVEELQAIRKQGGIAASPGTASSTETATDGLVVYYFHSNTRCPTCQSIESQAKDTVQTDFASQLTSGTIVWKVLNYEQPANVAVGEELRDSDAGRRAGKNENGEGRGLEASGRGLGTGRRQARLCQIHSRPDHANAGPRQATAPAESKPGGPAIPVPHNDSPQGVSCEGAPCHSCSRVDCFVQ